MLEVECQLQLPQIVQFMQITAAIEPMKKLMNLTGEEFDPEAIQGFGVLGLINQMLEGTPLIASALGSPEFRFIASLEDKWLRVAPDELQGEARLYCSVERKLKEGEQYNFIDMMPTLRNLPNRKEISPIAIFR